MIGKRIFGMMAIVLMSGQASLHAQGTDTPPQTSTIQWFTNQVGVAACTTCHVASNDEAFRDFQTHHAWVDVNRPASTNGLGADLIPVDGSLRTQLCLPEGQGLVVSGVTATGKAEECGLRPNDILLTLADKPLQAPYELVQQLKLASNRHGHEDDPIPLTLLRSGKTVTLQVKPEVHVTLGAVKEPTPEYYLGTPASVVDETLRSHLDIPEGTGLILGEITTDSPAGKAGLQENDILLSFDGKPVPEVETLREAIQATQGKEVKLQILRAGKPMTLSAKPELRKASPESGAVFQGSQSFDSLYLFDNAKTTSAREFHGTKGETSAQTFTKWTPTSGEPTADLKKEIATLNTRIEELTRAIESLSKAKQ